MNKYYDEILDAINADELDGNLTEKSANILRSTIKCNISRMESKKDKAFGISNKIDKIASGKII